MTLTRTSEKPCIRFKQAVRTLLAMGDALDIFPKAGAQRAFARD